MKKFKILTFAAILSFLLYSFTSVIIDQDEWKVPAKYETMKNPTDPKVDLNIGKSLYAKHCKSCHGTKGKGDGTKAKSLDTPVGDFTDASFKNQTDGSLYYKTFIGRDDMPNYEKKIPDEEDVWLVVNYMRTLKE